MNTWISRRGASLCLILALAGCEGGTGDGVLGRLSDTKTNAKAAPVALSQTKMANGALTLVPPEGFCIDKATLNQRFALIARCDSLGAPSAAGAAARGVLTVSVSRQARNGLPTPQQTADAVRLARISSEVVHDSAVTFRAEGAPPVEGLAIAHWRGTATIGGQVIGIALYGPEGGRATSDEGREIINELIELTAAAS